MAGGLLRDGRHASEGGVVRVCPILAQKAPKPGVAHVTLPAVQWEIRLFQIGGFPGAYRPRDKAKSKTGIRRPLQPYDAVWVITLGGNIQDPIATRPRGKR